jgi:hypothetical protein
MNIDKYITTVSNLNMLIETITNNDIEDVQNSINVAKEKIDMLDAQIQSRLATSNESNVIPYTDIRIEFFDTIKTNVRESVEKYEIELSGRENLKVVGFDAIEKFIVVRKNQWIKSVALKIYYKTIGTRIKQTGEYQLFYNERGDLSGYNMTRSGIKDGFRFEIISLS